jgi:hypothetical protein
MLAGVILVTIPTVMFGGMTLLVHLVGRAPGYFDNPLRLFATEAVACPREPDPLGAPRRLTRRCA